MSDLIDDPREGENVHEFTVSETPVPLNVHLKPNLAVFGSRVKWDVLY